MELYGKWRQRAEWMMIFHCSRLWGGSHSVWIPLYFVFVLLCSTSYLSSWHKFSCFFFLPGIFSPGINSTPSQRTSCLHHEAARATALLLQHLCLGAHTHTHTHKHTCWQKHTLIQKNHKRAHIRTHAHKCMETHTRTHTHTHTRSICLCLPPTAVTMGLSAKKMWDAPHYTHAQCTSYGAFSVGHDIHGRVECEEHEKSRKVLGVRWRTQNPVD